MKTRLHTSTALAVALLATPVLAAESPFSVSMVYPINAFETDWYVLLS
jgi:hypothetical protein